MRHQPRNDESCALLAELVESEQRDPPIACDLGGNETSPVYNEDDGFDTLHCSLPFTSEPQIAPITQPLPGPEWVVIDDVPRIKTSPTVPTSFLSLRPENREDSFESIVSDGLMLPHSSTPEIEKSELHYLQDNSSQSGQRRLPGFLGSYNELPKSGSRKKSIRKRGQLEKRPSDSEDTGDDSSDENGARMGSSRGDMGFACPFYRLDPVRHKDCVNRKLMRIRDVKQHIQRRHTQAAPYCPTCYLKFTSTDRRDRHIRSRHCEPREPETISKCDGISQKTQTLLKHRVDRGKSPSEQWYSIWDTIFKNSLSRPANPYLGTVVEETVGMIRDFWRQEAPKVLESQQISDSRYMPVQVATNLIDEVLARFQRKHGNDGSNADQPPSSNFSVPQPMDSPSSVLVGIEGSFVPSTFQSGLLASSPSPWSLSNPGIVPTYYGREAHQLESPTESDNTTSNIMANPVPYTSYNDPLWIVNATSSDFVDSRDPFSGSIFSDMHPDGQDRSL